MQARERNEVVRFRSLGVKCKAQFFQILDSNLRDATVGNPDLGAVQDPGFSIWAEFRPSFDRT